MASLKRMRIARRGRAAKGVTTVEAAITFGLLVLLTLGIIEYGWMMYKTQQVTNAARHGARVAVRPAATNAEALSAIAMLMDNAGIEGYNVNMPDVSGVATGETVTVTISVPYSNIQLGGPAFVPMPDTLKASVSMAKEGP